ncbi:energy transducer TonB [Caulobacter soli]|uniref:energy transducer TonB n=1 Tax=Caulobacter soli TaxID=2708539 RepID=UPI0013EE227A|nr:energy transducer TonB [Caulobacter soli]
MSYREDRTNFSPALVGSIALHGAIVVAILIGPWKPSKPVIIGESVPITVVTQGPTNVRPAIEDVVDQTAQTEEPTPEAQPQPPAPVPAPVPTPAPAPPKTAAPAPTPKPTPTKPAPAKPEPDFFASLEKTLAKTPKAAGKPVANAPKGPTRPETATQARPGAGAMTGLQAAAINGMKDEIQRRWNPNCEVEGGGAVQVKVSFKLATGGRIVGQVTAGDAERSPDPVVKAAADRAIRAVYQSAPFEGLPPDYYGQQLNLNFKARDACAAR